MDIKYSIKIEYMKCVLQTNGFSGPRPQVWSNYHPKSAILHSAIAGFEHFLRNNQFN